VRQNIRAYDRRNAAVIMHRGDMLRVLPETTAMLF
jgi:hypothetical protein